MRYFLFVILLLLISCNERQGQKHEYVEIESVKKDNVAFVAIDSLKYKPKGVLEKVDQPLPIFIDFVSKIQKDKWRFDVQRRKKVSSYDFLDDNDIIYFNEIPFYKLDFEDSAISEHKYYMEYYPEYFDGFDVELNAQVNSIWCYFYRGDKINYTISDGIIEQWKFDDANSATKFYMQINQVADIIYFNTMPFLYRKDNYVFIFHTRAMAFSYDQKRVFESFKKMAKSIN